ncbi:MAG: glycosyltransferase [Proteobacteria bacterium]|nr:glycosyltransferase [Pseudomonadota bacterium]
MIDVFHDYQSERKQNWDGIAKAQQNHLNLGKTYHKLLDRFFKSVVPTHMKVLELGCGEGDLLSELKPRSGVGVDFSPEMIKNARKKHPHMTFIEADIHDFEIEGTFDYIILSDLLNDLWDVQHALNHIKKYTVPETKIVFNFYSRVWELPLSLAIKMKWATPVLKQNWFSTMDVKDILYLTDYEVLQSGSEILCPIYIPVLSPFANRFLSKIWPFNFFNFTAVMIARPKPKENKPHAKVSVVVPARNEEGNIPDIVNRIPEMGLGTEILFIEGGSSDNTWQTIEKVIADNPDKNIQCARQNEKGKGDAVRKGFSLATGDLFMILDADMTVLPEDLPKFYDVWQSGKAEFVNGVRLVYPMQQEAMRFFNLLGNKFFSIAFSWVLGQPVKDTLCGTKVISRKNYEIIVRNRSFFGDFDPFGDFDLLFGAAKINLKIADLPIRYHARRYGETNIDRWRHGLILLRMLVFAAHKLKFI